MYSCLMQFPCLSFAKFTLLPRECRQSNPITYSRRAFSILRIHSLCFLFFRDEWGSLSSKFVLSLQSLEIEDALRMTVSFISLTAHSAIDFWDAFSPALQRRLNSSRTLFRLWVRYMRTSIFQLSFWISFGFQSLLQNVIFSVFIFVQYCRLCWAKVRATLLLIVIATDEQLRALYCTCSSIMNSRRDLHSTSIFCVDS